MFFFEGPVLRPSDGTHFNLSFTPAGYNSRGEFLLFVEMDPVHRRSSAPRTDYYLTFSPDPSIITGSLHCIIIVVVIT